MTIALTIIIVFLASLIEASFGFGGGLIAIPLLSLVLGIKDSIALFLVFQFLKGVLLFWGWRHIAFKHVYLVVLCLPMGVWIGYKTLLAVNAVWIEIALAVYLILFVVSQVMKKSEQLTPVKKLSPFAQITSGLGGGMVQGAIGTGGPFLVTHLKTLNLEKDVFRFTVIFLLFAANALRVLFSVDDQFFSERVINLLIYSMPAYLAALSIGYKIPRFLSEKQFNMIIHVLLSLSALLLLGKAVMSWAS